MAQRPQPQDFRQPRPAYLRWLGPTAAVDALGAQHERHSGIES
jgi:hypothetical protein